MLSTSSIFNQLQHDFPAITFEKGEGFRWSPATKTVFYVNLSRDEDFWSLLHELAHAILEHQTYTKDVELLAKESEAWHHAQTALGPRYDLEIPEDYAEDQLDSYRNWLHNRSRCPQCTQTGLQTQKNTYNCINCGRSWKVNDARMCALRRYLQS